MPLKEYLESKNIGLYSAKFADQLEISRQHLGDIAMGKKNPSPELAAKIEEATNGEVKASDLLRHLVPDGYRLVKDDHAEEKEAA